MQLLLFIVAAARGCKDLMTDCELHLDKCGNWYIQTYQCPLSCGTCEKQDDPLTADWVVVVPDIPTSAEAKTTATTTTKKMTTTTTSTIGSTTTTTRASFTTCADNPCSSQGASSCRDLSSAPFYQCECFANYEGYFCEIENCQCSNNGECSYCSTERCFCSCPAGWTGAYCDVRVIPDTTTKPPTTTTSTHRTSARVPYRDQKPVESDSDVMTYIYEYITYDDADDKATEEKTKARENPRAKNPLSFYFWYKMFMNLRQ